MPTTVFGWPLIPMPAWPAPRSIDFTAMDTVAVAVSPFTGRQQVQNWASAWLEASVSMPPMLHVTAQSWIAWLMGVQGQAGVFQLGDPLAANPQGSGGGAVTVSGAGQTGYALNVAGGSGAPVLLPGDWIQIGYRLYRCLSIYNGGAGSISIWPQIRESPLDGTAIVVTNTQGLFRLKSNSRKWSISDARMYGMEFEIREAL